MKYFWKDPNLIRTSSSGVNEYTLQFKKVYPLKIVEKNTLMENNKAYSGKLETWIHSKEVIDECIERIKSKNKGYCFSQKQVMAVIHRLQKLKYRLEEIIIRKDVNSNIYFIEAPTEKRCLSSENTESE